MKKLTLVRHAKSSWKDPHLTDEERPLNQRGRRDAPEMGRRLAERDVVPDLLISSPAERALTTAQLIAEAIGYPPEGIEEEDLLYLAGVDEWMEVIWSLDDALDQVMLFGHNPGLTDLVNTISTLRLANVPTCGVIELAFDIDRWCQVGRVRPRQATFDYPKKAD